MKYEMIYEDTKLLKIFHPYSVRGGAFFKLTGMFVKIFINCQSLFLNIPAFLKLVYRNDFFLPSSKITFARSFDLIIGLLNVFRCFHCTSEGVDQLTQQGNAS